MLNARQRALMEEIQAAGGSMWVESIVTYFHGKAMSTTGRMRMNAAHSMVSEKEKRYVPGGFKRQVVLRILVEEEVKRHVMHDPKVWMVTLERMLVEVL